MRIIYIEVISMKENSLFYFNNPNEFREFLKSLDLYGQWDIQYGLLNNRGREIENQSYTKYLRDAFQFKDFFRKQVSIAEIVSWLDTTSLMIRVLDVLEEKLESEVFKSLEISIEYMIEMSKKMRIDYLIIYKNTILLLEFRTVDRFTKIRPTWDLKFKELLQYKELMSYYLPDKLLRVYAFIPLYEYRGGVINEKNKMYNNNQVNYLSEYIQKYLVR